MWFCNIIIIDDDNTIHRNELKKKNRFHSTCILVFDINFNPKEQYLSNGNVFFALNWIFLIIFEVCFLTLLVVKLILNDGKTFLTVPNVS